MPNNHDRTLESLYEDFISHCATTDVTPEALANTKRVFFAGALSAWRLTCCAEASELVGDELKAFFKADREMDLSRH